jgi:hypothetical protein
MPVLEWGRTKVESLGNNLWSVTVEVRNERVIPTRLAIARQKNIGLPDALEVTGANQRTSVVAAGTMNDWLSRTMDEVRFEPGRVLLNGGVPGRGGVVVRFIVSGREGDRLNLAYRAEKAKDLEMSVELRESPRE